MGNFKFITGVLLGAAAGAALAMFLQSEKRQRNYRRYKNPPQPMP